MVAVLQCLQRLTSSRFVSADMVISPSYAARIFSALTCGDDSVATEVTHHDTSCSTTLFARYNVMSGLCKWMCAPADVCIVQAVLSLGIPDYVLSCCRQHDC